MSIETSILPSGPPLGALVRNFFLEGRIGVPIDMKMKNAHGIALLFEHISDSHALTVVGTTDKLVWQKY